MQNCQKCKGTAEYDLPGLGSICSSCFLTVMERRAKMELKRSGEIKKGDNVLLVNDGSKEFKVSEIFLRSITSKVPCKIIVSEKEQKADKIIIPWDADDEALMALQHICEKKPLFGQGKVKLLKGLLDSEVALVATIKGIKFEDTKSDNPTKPLLDQLEKQYPGTKFSLSKALQ